MYKTDIDQQDGSPLSDLVAARQLLQLALSEGQLPVALALAQTVTKLVATCRKHLVRESELLNDEVIFSFVANELVSGAADFLRESGKFSEAEIVEAIDRACKSMADELSPPPKEQ